MTIKYGSDFLTVHIDIVWTSRVEIFGLQQLYLRNRFSGTISVRMQKLSQKVSESQGIWYPQLEGDRFYIPERIVEFLG
ncbi:MAG: hypothetical protein P5702_15550 [Limnospira sp. PMC 1291.21]|uniref:Uncharacterized protein n=1 Tax=Limnospira fusiformis PMC 851.14 TaxID=2219512 RepID=A0ABU9EUH3_LIMFS|nr:MULTISPECIES: hypothetical protein [Limnospira]MDT9187945.1 hypothetical protein [Limnospira sp. PMC 894.15]MDT9209650.1 hypothetical protein [Limnospira sp. PMC 1252.20]MDT9240285.1 hypothetical protein [Limnospira sp. PMC 1261.20]MDT9250595.1 hypothetical protein [Limnospira sp. PMC 1280.21]MDT9286105.1 hypothetical protein [Limnospira sp. PMC 1298.21]MDT9306704.1 hypothetical protein [Limnospira sp. PMC 1291.21]MDT9316944.1 hypothetical protein [Limnospira sp. PMC 1306.21]QJB24455.1 h